MLGYLLKGDRLSNCSVEKIREKGDLTTHTSKSKAQEMCSSFREVTSHPTFGRLGFSVH